MQYFSIVILFFLSKLVIFAQTPTVNYIPNQTVCAGRSTASVAFSGAANTYLWSCSNPNIGINTNGIGNISAFTAINTTNLPITATITVTPRFDAKPPLAYIPNIDSNTVAIVSTQNDSILRKRFVGGYNSSVAINNNAHTVYIGRETSNTVTAIDMRTNAYISTISVGDRPIAMLLSPDGSRLYVANFDSNDISVISTATNTVISTIPVGNSPISICIGANNSRIYVANYQSNTISVIETTTNTVVQTISAIYGCKGIATNPSRTRLYVTNTFDNTVSVRNASDFSLISTINVGTNPSFICINQDGSRIYVSNSGNSKVSIINGLTNTLITSLQVNNQPNGMSLMPDGSKLYIVAYQQGYVSVMNTANNTIENTIFLGGGAFANGNFIAQSQAEILGQSTSFTITVNPNPIATITQSGAILTASNGASYLWNTGAPTANIAINTSGVYTVTITAANGCQQQATINAIITNTAAAVPIFTKIFPNPITDILTIETDNTQQNIVIFDALGRIVFQQKTLPNSIDTNNWTSGMYFVKIGEQVFKVVK